MKIQSLKRATKDIIEVLLNDKELDEIDKLELCKNIMLYLRPDLERYKKNNQVLQQVLDEENCKGYKKR